MLLIEAKNIELSYGERKIFEIEDIKIYSDDRIGIIGLNGAGKTTLVNILCGEIMPDKGYVKCHGKTSHITQLEESAAEALNNSTAAEFNTAAVWNKTMSGGEKTRFKIAASFDQDSNILFADEPTSNLDIDGIKLLEKRLREYKGAVVLISHDRAMLDKVCNKIYELEMGKLIIYNGNYSSYRIQKQAGIDRQQFEYDRYRSEKTRLENAMSKLQHKVKTMNKTPKRMGNSEARLHRLGNQRAEGNIDHSVKRIESRLEKLEIKERPIEIPSTSFYSPSGEELHKKVLISGSKLNKTFGQRRIFVDSAFDLYNGTKTALLGANGSGKTTLIKMIMSMETGIKAAEKLRIGYFSQALDILEDQKSILENVMESSCYSETFARIMLSRLLFKREEVYKITGTLSGGERVKVSFAKLFLADNNMLILDEPTNYLDTFSLEAVEELFCDYDRTILFVSHDRNFISKVANRIISIENKRLISFNGSYGEYLSASVEKKDIAKENRLNRVSILQNKRAELIGRLSMPSKRDNKELLEEQYNSVLKELKELETY